MPGLPEGGEDSSKRDRRLLPGLPAVQYAMKRTASAPRLNARSD